MVWMALLSVRNIKTEADPMTNNMDISPTSSQTRGENESVKRDKNTSETMVFTSVTFIYQGSAGAIQVILHIHFVFLKRCPAARSVCTIVTLPLHKRLELCACTLPNFQDLQ